MSKVTVLGSEDIKKLVTIPMALEAVEGAYAQKSRGEGGLWPMVFHGFDPGKADLDIKSGELGRTGYFWVQARLVVRREPGQGDAGALRHGDAL